VERLGDVQASQGIVAVAASPGGGAQDPAVAGRLLLLDRVQDPGNVGTLLRTAAWFGIDHAVAGPGTADFHGPKVVRASMGAIWDIALSESSDLAALVARLRAADFEVWGADMRGTRLADWTPAARSALVLGSEAAGLSAAVRDACTGTVTIPATGHIRGTESLNVGAAAAILMARLSGAG
jgi:TrmH family RNA methyltransferase